MADKPETDDLSGTETTGHEWDGIKELNSPLPRWWLYTFYLTIAWGLIYTILFPAWPMVSAATSGILGYSSRAELHAEVAAAEEAQRVYTDRIAELALEDIAADAELMSFSQGGGAAIFRTYCSQCHGAGAAGVQASGYPNLLDDDWIWGGTQEDIYLTIKHGIRYEADDDTRLSDMPAFGDDEILSADEIAAVADHVLSLSQQASSTELGAELYADNCSGCHGEEGLGEPALGAPNLADAIWLYGGERERVIETITHSRAGAMPAWAGRLTEAQIKQAALYVHSLGGGQ